LARREGNSRFRLNAQPQFEIFVKDPLDPPMPKEAKQAGRWSAEPLCSLAASNGFPDGFYSGQGIGGKRIIVIPETM